MRPLAEIALFTDDVAAGAAFYRRLLDAAPQAEWTGGAIFEAGGVTVLVHERSASTGGGPPNEDHVAFACADLDGTFEQLVAHGATAVAAPRSYPWGRSAYLRDPDGRLVELSEG